MDKIGSFLLNFDSDNTRRTYKSLLNQYFKVVKAEPNKYFVEGRKYEDDIKKFRQSLSGRPPKTIRTYIAGIKSFLMENDVELKEKFWKNIANRTKGSFSVTDDYIPTREELREILQHGSIKARAMFLVMVSSGIRIGELTKLYLDDIEVDKKPARIHIRYGIAKNRNPRTVFISNEAVNSLNSWLKERDDYLKRAVKKASHFKIKKPSKDDRIFPMDTNTCRQIWNGLLKKSGYSRKDKTTGWERTHPHCLRKYFSSHIKMSRDMVEGLLGHSGYLGKSYPRYTEKELMKEYQKAEPSISIFETPIDEERLEHLETEIKRRDEKLKVQEEDIEFLKSKLLESENELKRLGDDFIELGSSFDFVAKKLEKQEKKK